MKRIFGPIGEAVKHLYRDATHAQHYDDGMDRRVIERRSDDNSSSSGSDEGQGQDRMSPGALSVKARSSSMGGMSGAASDETGWSGMRSRLRQLVHSKRFQICVIVLVVTDCVLVISELLVELGAFKKENGEEKGSEETGSGSTTTLPCEKLEKLVHEVTEGPSADKIAETVLHYMSISILSLFMVELLVKIVALGKDYIRHPMEVIDGIIVVVSFVLDVVFIDSNDLAGTASELLILLRLWRVARIVNSIIMSMKIQAEKKLVHEKRLRDAAESELAKYRAYCSAQEKELESLQILLQTHGVPYTPPDRPRPPASSVISVVAEVNSFIDAHAKLADINMAPNPMSSTATSVDMADSPTAMLDSPSSTDTVTWSPAPSPPPVHISSHGGQGRSTEDV